MELTLGICAVLFVFYLFARAGVQREEAERQDRHSRALQALDLLCVKLDADRVNAAAIEARRLAENYAQGRELARMLQVIFESLHLVRNTRNRETLLSRLGVARKMLAEAREDHPGWISDDLAASIEDKLATAASAGLAGMAMGKVQALLAKAAAAKTVKTRDKYLQAAADLAALAADQPELSAADRARVAASAAAGVAPAVVDGHAAT